MFIIKLVNIFEFGLLRRLSICFIAVCSCFHCSIIHCTLLLSFWLNFVEFIVSCVGLDLKDITSADVVKELNHRVRLFAYTGFYVDQRISRLSSSWATGVQLTTTYRQLTEYQRYLLPTSMLLAVLQTFVMAEPYQKETCQKDKCVSKLEETAVFQQHFAFNNQILD